MDWLKDFYNKFGEVQDLKNFKHNNFTGSVTLNFSNGIVATCGVYSKKLHSLTASDTNRSFKAVSIEEEEVFFDR